MERNVKFGAHTYPTHTAKVHGAALDKGDHRALSAGNNAFRRCALRQIDVSGRPEMVLRSTGRTAGHMLIASVRREHGSTA